MKRRVFLIFGFLCLLLLESAAWAQTNTPYVWDFGRVEEGAVLKHNFVLKNESKKNLTIIDMNTSCGCTASKVKKKTLLPAEETLIAVRFNSKGYSGPVQQYIYVHTDNLTDPVIKFTINANVINK